MTDTSIIIDDPAYTPGKGWACELYSADTSKTVAHTRYNDSREAALEEARIVKAGLVAKLEQEAVR